MRDPNNRLERLDVGDNNIGDAGATALAQARDEIKREGREIEIYGI
jgi:hypothetical protein